MKPKHLTARVAQCLAIAACSPCSRRQFGAVAVDPGSNVVLLDAYNGTPRGAPGPLCGGDACERDRLGIASGSHYEIGCHHAEANLVANAARLGVRLAGALVIVSGEPCGGCAKLLHHAGIARVVCVRGGFVGGDGGCDYLRAHGVAVAYVEGPSDPRAPTAAP